MPRGKTTKARKEVIALMLRLPPELHAQVVAAAEAETVSLNEYITVVLLKHFADLEGFDAEREAINQRIDHLERQHQVLVAQLNAVLDNVTLTATGTVKG